MNKVVAALFGLFSGIVVAEENTTMVGRNVGANMDALSMILSLLMVLALIVVSAYVLKRFNFAQSNQTGLKVVTSLALSSKERLVVVQVGDQQLLLGVTAQQINLLNTLDQPLAPGKSASADFSQSLIKLIKK